MKIGIKYRLFLSLLAATGLVALGMFLIMHWSIDRGFLRYVNTLEQERLGRLAEGLEQAWAEEGGWEFLRKDPERWLKLVLRTLPEGTIAPDHLRRLERRLERRAGRDRLPPEPPPGFGQMFETRVVLLDAEKQPLLGSGELLRKRDLRPLVHQGRTVGYVGLVPRKELSDVHQLRFVRQQKTVLGLVSGLMLLVSAVLALPLANRLVRPIRALAAATHRLAAGRYETRVAQERGDELGQLTRDFNALALTLEKNEQARRQWVADISHELRTPLAVLRGEIEALQDGVRPLGAEALGSLHAEAMHLGRLVDDLYQLALSDLGALSYRKEAVELAPLLGEALAPYRAEFERKEIALAVADTHSAVPLFADPERLRQLFSNLLENALRYTDAGGRLEIEVARKGERAEVVFRDSAPGVPPSDLERLFERLYRVEGARRRATGGAGLGLAICRNIAEAHGGSITAAPSPLGGVAITVTLPLAGGER